MKRLFAYLVTAAMLATALVPAARADESPELNAAFEKYIMEHPDVLLKSLKRYRERDTITAQQLQLLNEAKGSPVVGNKDGDVTIVEFFDYHCGYCKRFYSVVNELVEQDKNLRFVFKEFPILSEDSELASRAALAVYNIAPEKYFGFHTSLMKFTGKFDQAKLNDLAMQAGISVGDFNDMMKSDKVTAELAANKQLGEQIGVAGTPLVVIGTQMIPGAIDIDALKAKIAIERAKGKKS